MIASSTPARAGRPHRPRRWPAVAAVVLAAGAALVWWFPSEQALAQRAADMASRQLGVPVTIGALHWALWPAPVLVLENLATVQPRPVQIDRLTARPRLASLWHGRLELAWLAIDGATVPQLSLRDLGTDADGNTAAFDPSGASGTAVPVAQLQVRDLRWISRTGITVVYDGEADFDPGWRPRTAQLRRPGFAPATTLTLTRQDRTDRWQTALRVGGGSADGEIALQTAPDGQLQLNGQLAPRNIEVLSALAAFNRRSPVSGQASGQTTLSASGRHLADIARSLHTHTTFTMGPATLVRFDLDRAVRSLGQQHAGTTRLDTVTGVLDTQNSADGMVSRFTGVKARSGVLSASGDATLAQRQIDAHVAVDLVDGVLGVPLRVQGPFNAPRVSVPGGAVAGAVVGTAVLPGVGTAIGARIGAAIGKLFGRGQAPPAPAPDKPEAERLR